MVTLVSKHNTLFSFRLAGGRPGVRDHRTSAVGRGSSVGHHCCVCEEREDYEAYTVDLVFRCM